MKWRAGKMLYGRGSELPQSIVSPFWENAVNSYDLENLD
jgi:hypothetical protein